MNVQSLGPVKQLIGKNPLLLSKLTSTIVKLFFSVYFWLTQTMEHSVWLWIYLVSKVYFMSSRIISLNIEDKRCTVNVCHN